MGTIARGTRVEVTTPISRTRAGVAYGTVVRGNVAGSDYYVVRLENGGETVASGDYVRPVRDEVARVLPEQSPRTWPGRMSEPVAERIALAELGYPTVADGDLLAVTRGPLARIAEVVR
jgi:hypothetical protein